MLCLPPAHRSSRWGVHTKPMMMINGRHHLSNLRCLATQSRVVLRTKSAENLQRAATATTHQTRVTHSISPIQAVELAILTGRFLIPIITCTISAQYIFPIVIQQYYQGNVIYHTIDQLLLVLIVIYGCVSR
jgi:hypothetical protein